MHPAPLMSSLSIQLKLSFTISGRTIMAPKPSHNAIDPVAEAIAQKRFKYAQLFRQQTKEIQKHPKPIVEEAYARVCEGWELAVNKPRGTWNNAGGDQEIAAYQEFLEGVCSMQPTCLDEYV